MKSPFAATKHQTDAAFYVALLEFLLLAKHQMIAIGDELGLTGLQAATLLLIDKQQARPMKNFCLLFHCDASNVTGIIDGLEQKGMVTRQSDPKDRRIKTIRLEAAGLRTKQRILEMLQAGEGFLFSGLTDSETRQFAQLVEKLAPSKKPA